MKKKIIIALIVIFIFTIIPLPITLNDGGTTTYNAILYRVIVWHAIDDSRPGGFRTGTEIHLFPKNFRDIDEFTEEY